MHYVEHGDKSEAYRHAYKTENMKPETVWRSANELFNNPKVTARVEALQARHQKRHDVTVDSITEELDRSRDIAERREESSAMTTAIMAKAKIHGLVNDKHQHTGKDGKPTEFTKIVRVIVRPTHRNG